MDDLDNSHMSIARLTTKQPTHIATSLHNMEVLT